MTAGFCPEFAGSEANRRGQAAILAGRVEIAATAGLVSRGNRITLVDPGCRTMAELLDLAVRFGSAGFLLPRSRMADTQAGFAAAGLQTASFVLYRGTGVAFARASTIIDGGLPDRLGLRRIVFDGDTSPSLIAAAQDLTAACGLPPLPGYFLRALTQRNLTLALLDPAGQVIAAATAMDESGGGPAFQGSYMVASVAVAADWRGHGLGRWLNAAAIDLARRTGDARQIHEGVSHRNTASRRMIEGCGLEEVRDQEILLATAEAPPAAWRD